MPSSPPEICQWLTLTEALKAFVLGLPSHQSARHIKRMHWYVACRLVLEGGLDDLRLVTSSESECVQFSGATNEQFSPGVDTKERRGNDSSSTMNPPRVADLDQKF